MQPLMDWILGGLAAAVIAGVAFRLSSLAPSGAIAAFAMGTIVVGAGGWWAGAILVLFFATSSAVSHLGPRHQQARGSRRDAVQVLANGWSILLGSVLWAITGEPAWLLFGFGGVAAATADTWSSEIGKFNTTPPRLITSGQIAPTGSSGAVSRLGTMASVAGAMLIATISALALRDDRDVMLVFMAVTLAGVAGGLIDSLLGATMQERRYCPACDVATESDPHRCGTRTILVGGVRGVNNDVVNTVCVLVGAMLGFVSGIL